MQTHMTLLWILAALGQPALHQHMIDMPRSELRFFLRVDPRLATEINEVLAQVAQRIEIVIPADRDVKEYLAKACGGHLPAYVAADVTEAGAAKKLRVAPCVQLRRNLRLEVTAGDTLEGLAIQNGLPRSAAMHLKVIPSGESKPRPIKPEDLQVGDVVVIPEAPLLASVEMNPEVIPDRAAFVQALANGLKCGEGDPEVCLARRKVTVLDSASARQPTLTRSPVSASEEVDVWPVGALPNEAPDFPAPPPPAPAFTLPALPSSELESIPVAPEQWPYDAGLVAAILKDAAAAGYIKDPTIVGIADAGLGSSLGGPLPAVVFDIGIEKIKGIEDGREEPDGDDNDGNLYVDDIFGAGVPRSGEIWGTGDLGLCETGQPPFATWATDPLRSASHGAVVSSIAAALGLRKIAPQAADALPKLVFFRMLKSACSQDASFSIAPGEMAKAFEYLKYRSNIINISYIVDEEVGSGFVSEVKDKIPNDVLLVLPADDSPYNLDDRGDCLPCLGNDSSDHGGSAAKSVLVVGAAERTLQRASYSAFGERTVGIFAPGEPIGALDLADQQVSPADTSTSNASPLVALAAGIVRSFGGKNSPIDIKDRLLAATWPLQDEDSRPSRTHVGVLDLVKAAAVRYHAVEVKEYGSDGQPVRRTYVGKLLKPLRDLRLCNAAFQEEAVHAIRLGEPKEDGERQLLVYYRRIDPGTRRRLVKALYCRPEGDLTIRTLAQDDKPSFDKTVPLSEVTQIQLKWILH